ncbi:hypothetical protein [Martelella alba]|uniref:Uncharacterized protein n=1 Tax=Martelella alba TaxID=2590451 RepID=A0ABY2SDQ8_9HYPH|nr:hypothetical protein [Martelella alba]TKI02677.1 hypothetical protein FCN80_24275 [Martelella alba]
MTRDEETVLLFKGLIASLTAEQQVKVNECLTTIRQMIQDHPDGEAVIAIGLVGAELQQAA